MSASPRLLLGCSCALLLAASPEQNALRSRELSGPFAVPPTVVGRVIEFQVSAATGRIVYRADQEVDERYELFSVPIDGSAGPVKLHSTLLPLQFLSSWELSPDGARALVLGRLGAEPLTSLYAAAVDGSAAPVKLSGADNTSTFAVGSDGVRAVFWTPASDSLFSTPLDASSGPVPIQAPFSGASQTPFFEISPDGAAVAYLIFLGYLQDETPWHELYAAPIDGSGTALRLNGPLVAEGGVLTDFRFSADGARVVYRADQDANGLFEIFSAPIGGSGPTQLNSPLVAGGDVQTFEVAPGRVVYRADQDVNERFELYSVPVDGSAPAVKLNGALPPTGDVQAGFPISPDGTRVVYRADPNLDEVFELFSVPIDGSAGALPLHAPLAAGQSVQSDPSIGPDGARVAYRVAVQFAGTSLYSVPIDGSAAPVDLADLHAFGHEASGQRFSPDSSTIAYMADADGNVAELYTVPAAGGASPVKVSGTFQPGVATQRGIVAFAFDGTGERLAYTANQDSDLANELYGTLADGSGSAYKLNAPLPLGPHRGDVASFSLSPDGRRALYVADQDVDQDFELYSVALDGSTAAVKLSGPLVAGGDVLSTFELAFTPDGSRVVYRADQDTDEVVELYGALTDGSAPPVRLSGNMVSGGDVEAARFQVAPNGLRVIYQADQETDGVVELFSAPVDGSDRPVKLSARRPRVRRVAGGETLPSKADVLYSLVDPSGLWVAFVADQDTDDVLELYGVPIDGSAAPTKLNGSFGPQADVLSLVAIRQERVVYLADAATNGVSELYSVPLLGTASPVKLNGTLAGGGIQSIRISPDGSRVLYLAAQVTATMVELYSAPIAGGASAARLNGLLVSGGNVQSYAFAPDGLRVVYVADEVTNDVTELFVAPVDGSAPSSRIPGTQRAQAGFTHVVTPDGARVVYLARPDAIRSELFSVPLDGGAPPVRLNGPMTAQSQVTSFRLALDGRKAVYLSDPQAQQTYELFAVPVEGTAVPFRLHGELAPGGDVLTFAIGPNEAVYRADLENDTVEELFASTLSREPARGPPVNVP